jgi:bacteriorhodopsin
VNEFEIIATIVGVVWFGFIGVWGLTAGQQH